MSWIQSSGKSCYSGSDDSALSQSGILTIGKMYYVSLTISGMTQGKLVFDSFEGKPEYTEDGDISFFGIATIPSFILKADEVSGSMFNGCVDSVIVQYAPIYIIKDMEDNVVYTSDESDVEFSGNKLQFIVNWEDLEEGKYKLTFSDGGVDYESNCFDVKTEHDCTKQLTWTNDDNAYGFDFTEGFTQSLRVKCKKWHPSYKKNKETFEDSQGNISVIRSSSKKIEILGIEEMPEYLHDALSIGIEHDLFEIDGIPYVVEDSEYSPKWRNSSQLAPVEIEVIKATQNLVNENCG